MNRPESVTQVHLTGDTLPAIRPDAAKSAEGGTEVDAAFSHLGNCASLDEARDRAEIFAQNWVEENIFR